MTVNSLTTLSRLVLGLICFTATFLTLALMKRQEQPAVYFILFFKLSPETGAQCEPVWPSDKAVGW